MIAIAPPGVSVLRLFKKQAYRGCCVVADRHLGDELPELPGAEFALFSKDIARAGQSMKTACNSAGINCGA